MRNPLKELYNANDAVEHSIDRLEFEGRSAVSRDVVGYLRHLVEHIAMYATYGNRPIEGDYFKLCSVAIKDMSKNSETRFIAKFHHYLQKVVSHYVPSEDSAERLLLKYYENLLCLKRYAFDSCSKFDRILVYSSFRMPLIIQWWFRLSARVSTVLALLFLLRLLMHMRFQYAPVS